MYLCTCVRFNVNVAVMVIQCKQNWIVSCWRSVFFKMNKPFVVQSSIVWTKINVPIWTVSLKIRIHSFSWINHHKRYEMPVWTHTKYTSEGSSSLCRRCGTNPLCTFLSKHLRTLPLYCVNSCYVLTVQSTGFNVEFVNNTFEDRKKLFYFSLVKTIASVYTSVLRLP